MQRNRRSRLIFALVFLVTIAAYYCPVSSGIYRVLQLKIYDSFLRTAGSLEDWDAKPVLDDICIVDIGEQSIEELGQYSGWPSLFFADLVDTLSAHGARVIAFDVFFTESDSLSSFTRSRLAQHLRSKNLDPDAVLPALSSDYVLTDAISRAGNVYLPMFGTHTENPNLVLLPSSVLSPKLKNPPKTYPLEHLHLPVHYLANAAKGVGLAHIFSDESGNIHDYPLFFTYEDQYLLNFSTHACLDVLGAGIETKDKNVFLRFADNSTHKLPLDDQGKYHLRYYGSAGRFRYIQISDVLKGKLEPGFFKDKIVLIGSSAAGLRDSKATPLGRDVPGVELHATFMQNMLNKEHIHWLPTWLGWLLALLLLLASRLMVNRLKPVSSVTIFVAISLLLLLLCYFIFANYYYAMSYSSLFIPWILGFITIMIDESQTQHHEKKKVKHAFEHYVSKAVIKEVLADPKSLRIGGSKRQAGIMFADIRNFSTICEHMHPDAVSAFLHDYFNRCTKIVTKHNGMLDKYIGDAILALFNVPVDQTQYQIQACQCALELIEEVDKIRSENLDKTLIANLRIGVGLASGSIIAGNLGSDEIFNYTGIGDKMNLASRLESLNKFYLTRIIVDNETYQATADKFLFRWLDRVCVKGKQEAVDIYELLGLSNSHKDKRQHLEAYEKALNALCRKEIDEAARLFDKAADLNPKDYPTILMQLRIKNLDPNSWDGVYRHILK